METCISDDTFAALVDGKVAGEELAALERHIDACGACRGMVAGLARSCFQPSGGEASAARSGESAETRAGSSAPPPPPPQLDEYRIGELLGQGQMGRVYAGLDTTLDRPIAIKFLSSAAPDERTRARFRQEARAIARLKHPGVVSIYRAGDIEGQPFIVSEFIEGQSLDRIPKPMPWREVAQIGAALAAALSAAHRSGVLHRDIKPGNVMLTSEGEAKLLDFGLAKLLDQLGPSDAPAPTAEGAETGELPPSVTRTGAVVGTPRYLAPEIFTGQAATQQTDLYALSALLYELTTGQPPFSQPSLAELRRAVLDQQPLPLRTLAPTADKRFAAIVDRCLSKDPTRRLADAAALATALRALNGSAPAGTARRIRFAAWPLVLLCGAGLAGGVFSYQSRERAGSHQAQKSPASRRRAVAILGFSNLSGRTEHAWLSTALTEMLRTELAAGDMLQLIPAETVAQLKYMLRIADSGSLGRETLSKMRAQSGTDFVLLGSLTQGAQGTIPILRLDYRLQNTDSGEVLIESAETVGVGELFVLATRAGSKLRERLGLAPPDPTDQIAVRASVPEDPEAARLYSEGLSRFHAFDLPQAQAALERAAERAPESPVVFRALADVYAMTGHHERQRAAAERVLRFAGKLRKEEQLHAEATYAFAQNDYANASRLLSELQSYYPDTFEYGLWLAGMQQSAGRYEEALATIAALRSRLPLAAEDPRLDWTAAFNYLSLAQFDAALEASRRAQQRAQLRGLRYLAVCARAREGWVLRSMERYSEAEAVLEVAVKELSGFGVTKQGAVALQGLASVKRRRGDLRTAAELMQQVIQDLESLGNETDLAYALVEMPTLLVQLGQLNAANQYAQRGLALNNPKLPALNRAVLALGLGEFYRLIGQLEKSQRLYTELIGFCGSDQDCHAKLLIGKSRILLAAADLRGARRILDEVMQKLPNQTSRVAALAQCELAQVELAEDRPQQAAELAHRALQNFHHQQALFEESIARAVYVRALVAAGKKDAAHQEAAILDSKVSERDCVYLRSVVTQAVARASANSTDPAQQTAMKARLQTSLAALQRSGLASEELELRLTLGALPEEPKDDKQGQLLTLAQDAKKLGFVLIASQATALASANVRRSSR